MSNTSTPTPDEPMRAALRRRDEAVVRQYEAVMALVRAGRASEIPTFALAVTG